MASLRTSLIAGLRRQLPRLAIALIAVLLCWRALPDLPPPGWDEAENLGLPAVRCWDDLRHGEVLASLHALLGQEQNPPGAALLLAPAFWMGAPDPVTARAAIALLFGLLSMLAGAIADHLVGSRETTRAGWITQGLVLSSPAAVALGRSLFLEIPFAFLAALGTLLYVKLERRELENLPPGRPRTLAVYLLPGACLASACFTKWSYASLLLLALFAERLCATWRAREERRRSLRATCWLALPLLAGAIWWFGLPWPGDLGVVGASHRYAFFSYLSEERAAGVPWSAIALYGGWYHHLSPAVLLGIVPLLGLAAHHRHRPGVRFVALLSFCLLVGALMHPFKLSRLFLPGLIFLWIAAGVGFHAATRRLRSPLKAMSVLTAAFLALLSASEGLFTPERFGLQPVAESTLRLWRDAYASRNVEASGPEGLPDLAREIAKHMPHGAPLRVARTGHELSDAALAWAIFLAQREQAEDPHAVRVPSAFASAHFDLLRLAATPEWHAEESARYADEARAWLKEAEVCVVIDPDGESTAPFRLEDPTFAMRWRAAVRDVLPTQGFQRVLEEPRFAFSRRRASVALELWIRQHKTP